MSFLLQAIYVLSKSEKRLKIIDVSHLRAVGYTLRQALRLATKEVIDVPHSRVAGYGTPEFGREADE